MLLFAGFQSRPTEIRALFTFRSLSSQILCLLAIRILSNYSHTIGENLSGLRPSDEPKRDRREAPLFSPSKKLEGFGSLLSAQEVGA